MVDQRTIENLFALLRSAIRGTKLTEEEYKAYSPELLQDLLKISSKHDVVHLLVLGLKNNNLIPEGNTDLEKHILKAVWRYERIRYEFENLCNALEKAKIPFLPLKGSVIRKYYPEPWMRTSCDIDILIHEKDAEAVKLILINKYRYIYRGKSSHDISMFTPNNIHIELHYKLVEDNVANEASEVLKNVWDMAVIKEGCLFRFEMLDEMYYFYHIAHMAKHFENGGCGIRPFIDLWILDNIQNSDKEKYNSLLKKGKTLKFADVVRKLSRVWLSNEEHDPISKQMENYILHGGVYGNSENRVLVQQQKKGGPIRYALSKIFIPYEVIKFYYPILQKYRWLTPIMEVRRWCKLLFCGHLKRTTNELQYNMNITNTEAEEMKQLLNELGL